MDVENEVVGQAAIDRKDYYEYSAKRSAARLADHVDSDRSALELFELIARSFVGPEVNCLVGVTDTGRIVIEADVAPRNIVDEIAVLGI